MSHIAQQTGVRVSDLIKVNQLHNDHLYPGESLIYPVNYGNRHTRYYEVRPGDNLSWIAQHFGTTVKQLVYWNHVSPDAVLPVGRRYDRTMMAVLSCASLAGLWQGNVHDQHHLFSPATTTLSLRLQYHSPWLLGQVVTASNHSPFPVGSHFQARCNHGVLTRYYLRNNAVVQ